MSDNKGILQQAAQIAGAVTGKPSANSTWFNFSCGGGSFGVYSFSGREAISESFEFRIELVSVSSGLQPSGYVGKPGCLTIADRSGGTRTVHGIIREFRQLHTANLRTHYECLLVPRLWFLTQTCDHRIFQQKTVVDIIGEVLQGQGFTADGFSFKCGGSSEPREYCVQYGESDFHFINRLCEEEGIFYYHEHSASGHCLTFCNMPGAQPIPGESSLRYFQGSGNVADTAVIARLALHSAVNSDESTYREWNFSTPTLDLTVNEKEGDAEKAPVPTGMKLETYKYPHSYQELGPGRQYAKIQLQRQLTYAKWASGEADVSRLTPAFAFTLTQHPNGEANAEWMVTEVEHFGEQPGVLEHEAPDRGLRYNAAFRAIPSQTPFVPPLRHPKVRVPGEQTAIVTGPEGEEIYPDEYGRVKVQFFWDRLDQWNEKTTCWIRVSQGWAGPKYGIMAIPRIGHEVIVSFLEGDPDRPIITGRVYHADNMPPYELPDNKTRTVFKSMSTPGEENEERGFNELRIEDKKDYEEIFLHAQKDVNAHVKNDWKEHVLNDKHRTVDHDSFTWIKGEDHHVLEQARKMELRASDHLIVKGDSHASYETKWLAKVGQDLHFKAGDNVVIEAGSDLTVKGGGAFIRLTPAGVTIMGSKVKINEGGSPGTATDAAPEAVTEATGVGPSGNPIAPEQRKGKGEANTDDEGNKNDEIETAGNGPLGKTESSPTSMAAGYWGKEPKQCLPYDSSRPSGQRTLDRVKKESENFAGILTQEQKSQVYSDAGNEKLGEMQEAIKNANILAEKSNKSVAAKRFRYLVSGTTEKKTLEEKLRHIDEKVNIYKYVADPKGQDHWKKPEEFLRDVSGRAASGDCEDYAILKYTVLAQAGVPKENMRIIAVQSTVKKESHALLVVDEPATGKRYYMDNYHTFDEYPFQYTPMYYVTDEESCGF